MDGTKNIDNRERVLAERLDRLLAMLQSSNDLLVQARGRPCPRCGTMTQFNLCWGCEGKRRVAGN